MTHLEPSCGPDEHHPAGGPNPDWLVVTEAIPLVRLSTTKPESIGRTIRRWIAKGRLPARRAQGPELGELLLARRIVGLPPEGYVYLIHRDALLHVLSERGARR